MYVLMQIIEELYECFDSSLSFVREFITGTASFAVSNCMEHFIFSVSRYVYKKNIIVGNDRFDCHGLMILGDCECHSNGNLFWADNSNKILSKKPYCGDECQYIAILSY